MEEKNNNRENNKRFLFNSDNILNMRKIKLLMHVSLDGFVCGPSGEMNWIKLSEELFEHVKTITDQADTALYGAVTYKMMEDYWPNAGKEPGASKHDIDHSNWFNTVAKYVFSKEDMTTSQPNTFVIRDNIAEEMQKLKNTPGKDILMLGSPSLAHSFMDLGLIDEFYINVNPVVIGSGKPLFKDAKMQLELISSKEFSIGVVNFHYTLKQ